MIRKITVFAALLVLISSLTLTAFAAQTSLAVSNPSPTFGETVTVTVSLSGCLSANTLGVAVDYDSSVLELTADSKWMISGLLSSIEIATGRAAFVAEDSDTDLNGDIIKLVFKVKDANFDTTSINVDVIVKDNSVTLETLSAGALLGGASDVHTHTYENGICTVCGDILVTTTPDTTPATEPEIEPDVDPEAEPEVEPEVDVDDEPDIEVDEEPDVTQSEEPDVSESTTTESSETTEVTTTESTGEETGDTTTEMTSDETTSESDTSESETSAATTSQPESEPEESADEIADTPSSTNAEDDSNPMPVIIAVVVALAAAAGITVFITKKKK